MATSLGRKEFRNGQQFDIRGFAADRFSGQRQSLTQLCQSVHQSDFARLRVAVRTGHSIHTTDASRPVGASRRWLNNVASATVQPQVDLDRSDTQCLELPQDSGPQVQSRCAGRGHRAAAGKRRLHLVGHRRGHLVIGAADRRSQHNRTSSACAPAASMTSSVRATTPLAAPTRPACAAPITPARSSAISTGTQSAVTTAKCQPRHGRHQTRRCPESEDARDPTVVRRRARHGHRAPGSSTRRGRCPGRWRRRGVSGWPPRRPGHHRHGRRG